MKKNFLVVIIFFLILTVSIVSVQPVQAAIEEVALIRQDCAGYANCFNSLADWEAGYGGISFGACALGDLFCADKIAVAKIDGVWTVADTKALVIDGWSTGPNNYLRIYTTAAARHSGTANTGYRLAVSESDIEAVVDLREAYVRLEGLEIYSAGPAQSHVVYVRPNAMENLGEIRLSYSVIHGDGLNTRNGIYNFDLTGTLKIWNNIIYDVAKETTDAGIRMLTGTNFLHQNTIVETIAGYGIKVDSGVKVIAKNNLVKAKNNCYYGAFNSAATSSEDSSYNTSSDNTTAGSESDKTNQVYAFVDTVNDNFHLAVTDTAAKDAGAGLTGDKILPITDDIDGDTRASSYDIGADEYTGTIPAYCGDGKCNGNENSDSCAKDCPVIDSAPPVRSDSAPIGILEAATQTKISLKTDETAICKYSITAGLDYASTTGEMLAQENGTYHSATITGLSSGNSYVYYVKCQDAAGNANTDDYQISFLVAALVIPPVQPVEEPKKESVTIKPVFSYGKPRLASLFEEQNKAKELKNELEKIYGAGKIPVARKHWPTIVNAYIYGNYPVKTITQAIRFGGKTVHPSITHESWQNAVDYKNWIAK